MIRDVSTLCRYFERLVGVKQRVGRDLLTWNQLQEAVSSVNSSAQDEHQRTSNTTRHRTATDVLTQ